MALPEGTPKELECVAHLKEHVTAAMLDPADTSFLTEQTYLSFARAKKGDKKKALDSMMKCAEWRKEYKPFAITKESVAKAMAGPCFALGGICTEGRPVLVFGLGLKHDLTLEERLRQVVFLMEQLRLKGYYAATIIVDFYGVKMGSEDPDGRRAKSQSEKVLTDYYPCSMARSVLYRAPWFIQLVPGNDKAGNIAGLAKYVAADQMPVRAEGTMKESTEEILENLPSLVK